MANRRALHFVLKVACLSDNLKFFRNQLGMTVLRHEVFDSGCEASCNGPYDNKWSKTMIGYGPENDHFVLELTYNYTIGKYKLGNDLNYIKIAAQEDLFNRIKESGPKNASKDDKKLELLSPDGYMFIVERGDKSTESDVVEICTSSTDLKKTKDYWIDLLKCTVYSESDTDLVFGYGEKQARIKMIKIDTGLDRGTAHGRIAFSCPSDQLKPIEGEIKDKKHTILTPYISLDTPGKASVQVVILADPNGLEICFVGDEGFSELSKVDPEANKLIEKSIEEDKSNEWFATKKKAKTEAES